MNLKGLATEEIKQIRERLVGSYIGEWEKPKQYFDQLKEIDTKLKTMEDEHEDDITNDYGWYCAGCGDCEDCEWLGGGQLEEDKLKQQNNEHKE